MLWPAVSAHGFSTRWGPEKTYAYVGNLKPNSKDSAQQQHRFFSNSARKATSLCRSRIRRSLTTIRALYPQSAFAFRRPTLPPCGELSSRPLRQTWTNRETLDRQGNSRYRASTQLQQLLMPCMSLQCFSICAGANRLCWRPSS